MSQMKDLIARLRLDTGPFKRGTDDARVAASGLAGHMRGVLVPLAGALAAAFSSSAL